MRCSARSYDLTNIYISEYDLLQRPTKSDIAETRALLNDFCIVAIIPEFNTVKQLLDWRKNTILNVNFDYLEIRQSRQKRTGRKRKVSIDDFRGHYQRFINDEVTKQELASELHISLSTVQSLIRETITGSR